jgi:cytoskeletal protein CcmA (bactofilin family)
LAPRAIIAEGINILGCLQTDGEVQVDGEINGDVRCAHLTIGKSGTINGDITATEVVIRGTVKGAIEAQRVIIQEGAHVESDICHERFAIEEGAYFKGSCRPKGIEAAASADAPQHIADDCKETA